ncbi:MAG: hypothetical protein ACKODK_08425 [Opitutaceae bacterium]
MPEHRDTAVGERVPVRDTLVVHSGSRELREIDAVDAARVSGGDQHGLGVELKQIKDRVDRQQRSGDNRAVAQKVERAFGRGAGEHGAVSET